MGSRQVVVMLGVIAAAGGSWWVSRVRAAGVPPSPRAARGNIELTVYAGDFALVREVRPVELARGRSRVQLVEVSKQLDPHSVLLRWQGSPRGGAQLLAHSYDLGVASTPELLKRYLGKEVEVLRYADNGREVDRQRGTLVVEAGGEIVLQTDGKLYIHPQGTIVASTQDGMVTIPQLSVDAESPAAQALPLEMAYLTRGLSWSADYVATVSPRSNSLALECWATVTNRTGTDYPNARVSLVAGAPNRAVSPALHAYENEAYHFMKSRITGSGRLSRTRAVASALPISVEAPEGAGDLQVYPVRAPAMVLQAQMNRLLMLAGADVPIRREYTARPPTLGGWEDDYYAGTLRQPMRGSVQVAFSFANEAKSGLGVPLPQGALRVYEPDRGGSLGYAGAAAVSDTPLHQKVHVTLARAFDVFTEWRMVKRQKVAKRTTRKQVELVLHNEKPAGVEVRVVQGFSGRWKLVSASHPHVKLDADHAQWSVRVPASGKAVLHFSVDLAS